MIDVENSYGAFLGLIEIFFELSLSDFFGAEKEIFCDFMDTFFESFFGLCCASGILAVAVIILF